MCDLRGMGCLWQVCRAIPRHLESGRGLVVSVLEHLHPWLIDAGYLQDSKGLPAMLELPLIKTAYSRVKIRTRALQTTITRNAMVHLGNGTQGTTIDCTHFSRWPDAAQKCRQLMHGSAPPDKQQEWVLILASPFLSPRDYFHFIQVSCIPR